jgi:predicted MFS family arabinose efflux permease
VNGVSFLAVILSLMMIQVKFVPAKSKETILKSMSEGIAFIRQREGLAALVFLAFSTTLVGFSLTGFLPVIVRTVFQGGSQTYLLLLVCSGAGSIVGALIVAASERLKGHGHVALLTLLALGTAIVGFAMSRWLPLSCALIFISGAAIMASASLMLSLVQLIVSEQMRGRVMGVYSLAFRAGIPLGSLALGKLIPIFGMTAALGGSGILLITITLIFLIVMRSVATFQRAAETAR